MTNDKKNVNLKNTYSFIDRYRIKKSNLFWKVVDNLSFMNEKIGKIYEKTISKEYEKEINNLGLNNSKNILHIGCGSYPISAIAFSRIKDSNIVAIDNNKKAVKKARKIIFEKKLDNNIVIKEGDGASFSIEEFDTIIVSGCSIPKTKILKNIFEKSKKDTKIIVREQDDISKIILKIAEEYKDIKIIKKMGNKPFPTSSWISYYFLKK